MMPMCQTCDGERCFVRADEIIKVVNQLFIPLSSRIGPIAHLQSISLRQTPMGL